MMISNLKTVATLGQSKQRKFGTVVLVEHPITHTKYVLKHAKVNRISQQAFRQLKNESFFSFSHPQLPKVVQSEQINDTFSLLLSYKNGRTLSEVWTQIPKKQRLLFTQLWVEKLISLLDYLHAHDIYHCDLKPTNLLIETSEHDVLDNFDLHLLDFGMAIDKKKEQKEKNTLIFPLGFASPEQILQRTHLIHPSTDYFAIGISVYYLWTHQLPLTHPNPSIFTNLQLAHPIPYHRKMPHHLNEWIAKACYKPPWKTAPNLMTKTQIDQLLTESFQHRYADSTSLLHDLMK